MYDLGVGEGLRPFDPLRRSALRCGVRVRPAREPTPVVCRWRGLAAALALSGLCRGDPCSRPRHGLPPPASFPEAESSASR